MIDVSEFVASLEGRKVAVFGLGLSGMASVRALVKAGASVVAWDDDPDKCTLAEKAGAEIVNLSDEGDFSGYACLVLSPGIPLHFPKPHEVVRKAGEAGVEIIGDIEVLHRCNHGKRVVGITGTNGKSTTTALVGHILKECGFKVAVGGNFGKAALDLTLPAGKDGVIVLEISSYQMDLCPTFRPDISVMLNITPDHTDRHGGMEGYIESKARIFEGEGIGICGVDDEPSRKVYETIRQRGKRKAVSISVNNDEHAGVYAVDGKLFDNMNMDGKAVEVGSIGNILRLPGEHNQQNICAAYAVGRELGIEPDAIMEAVNSYPGLEHRQFPVAVINGVGYINDSKATNAEAAAKALSCNRNIFWIVGGKPKEGGLSGLECYADRISHAFLIGESADEFARWMDNHGVDYTVSKTLDEAVLQAHKMAQDERGQPGGAGSVLLSPACASFDQFSSFEERGKRFEELVMELVREEEKKEKEKEKSDKGDKGDKG